MCRNDLPSPIFMFKENVMFVRTPSKEELEYFILTKHYAQRMPSVSYAFGLYNEIGECLGVCTFGKPASNSLCVGVCGREMSHKVYELNRLITVDGLVKNVLSWFLASCLRELKSDDIIVVSYADAGVGHTGYIYQATNFLYTGKTKERTDKYTPNGKHSRHYTEEYNHLRKFRTSKHRYVFFTGKSRKKLLSALNYPVQSYPKGDNINYTLGEKAKQKVLNNLTGEITYE